MKELYSALVKAQSQIRGAVKDSVNPHFKNRYADLGSVWDACRDALHKNGLAVIQLSDVDSSGAPVLLTRIIHESGQHIEGRYPLVCKDPNDPQKLGSATTYARRYALAAAIGIIQEDDDGQAAATKPQVTQAPVAPAPKPSATGMSELFAAHKLEYPAALEKAIGLPMAEWSEAQKAVAREAIASLKAGKPWTLVSKTLAGAAAFS